MPTYAYVCQACEHACEYFQSMSESPKRKCPECGALKLQRQIGGGAAILFKGSGFYQTDYRSDSYKAGEKAASKGDGGSQGDGGSKADSSKKSKPSGDSKAD